jgi:hypothetical protein
MKANARGSEHTVKNVKAISRDVIVRKVVLRLHHNGRVWVNDTEVILPHKHSAISVALHLMSGVELK